MLPPPSAGRMMPPLWAVSMLLADAEQPSGAGLMLPPCWLTLTAAAPPSWIGFTLPPSRAGLLLPTVAVPLSCACLVLLAGPLAAA